MFQCLGWMEKNFILGNFSLSVAAETWDASCFKKGLLEKQQSAPNTCAILPLEKIFYQNLEDAFFKYLLSILRYLFQKYYLYCYYAVLIFTSKLCDPHRTIQSPPTTKIKISDPTPAKPFLKFLIPSPKLVGGGGGVHALKAKLKLSPLIQNRVQQDYLLESYARHLISYQKCHEIVALTRCGLFPLPLNLFR